MEKIVIFALVILSCVALSLSDSHTTTPTGSNFTASVTVKPTNNNTEASTTVSAKTTAATGPTSGAVSFTASAGLVVSLVMALLH